VAFLEQKQLHLAQVLVIGHRLVFVSHRAHQNEFFLEQGYFGQGRFGDRQGDNGCVKQAIGEFANQNGRQ